MAAANPRVEGHRNAPRGIPVSAGPVANRLGVTWLANGSTPRRAAHLVALLTLLALITGSLTALVAPEAKADSGFGEVQFLDPGLSEWQVPAGVSGVNVWVVGAGGGGSQLGVGRPGTIVMAPLSVVEGDKLSIDVGAGGGVAGWDDELLGGGGGGGSSSVSPSGGHALVIAGGGGGAGGVPDANGNFQFLSTTQYVTYSNGGVNGSDGVGGEGGNWDDGEDLWSVTGCCGASGGSPGVREGGPGGAGGGAVDVGVGFGGGGAASGSGGGGQGAYAPTHPHLGGGGGGGGGFGGGGGGSVGYTRQLCWPNACDGSIEISAGAGGQGGSLRPPGSSTETAHNGGSAGAAGQQGWVTISWNVPQTINFERIQDQVVGVTPVALSATATSGRPVVFTSGTPEVCTVNSATVRVLAPGLCTVNADAPASGGYLAAPTAVRSFGVAAPPGETDSDSDGVPDSVDDFPANPAKQKLAIPTGATHTPTGLGKTQVRWQLTSDDVNDHDITGYQVWTQMPKARTTPAVRAGGANAVASKAGVAGRRVLCSAKSGVSRCQIRRAIGAGVRLHVTAYNKHGVSDDVVTRWRPAHRPVTLGKAHFKLRSCHMTARNTRRARQLTARLIGSGFRSATVQISSRTDGGRTVAMARAKAIKALMRSVARRSKGAPLRVKVSITATPGPRRSLNILGQ